MNDNDKEWRDFMLSEIKEVKKTQDEIKEIVYINNMNISNLKIKLSFLYSSGGILAGIVGAYFGNKLGIK